MYCYELSFVVVWGTPEICPRILDTPCINGRVCYMEDVCSVCTVFKIGQGIPAAANERE